MDLIFTGYDVDAVDRGQEAAVAASATNSRLVSTGMARSIAIIQQFCHSDLRAPRIAVHDDTGLEGQADGDLVVILGSEANNDLAGNNMNRVRREFDMPYMLAFSVESRRVELVDVESRLTFAPERIRTQVTKDYALVIKARLLRAPRREIVIVSGCHMWGTWSACEAITTSAWMRDVLNELPDAPLDQLLVVSTDVVQGIPQGANPLVAKKLKRREASSPTSAR